MCLYVCVLTHTHRISPQIKPEIRGISGDYLFTTPFIRCIPLLTINAYRCRTSRLTFNLQQAWNLRQQLRPCGDTWRTRRKIRVVCYSGPFAPSCENTTSSTQPEVHNVLHCRQRITEPRPQVIGAEKIVNFEQLIFEICERTDRQTCRRADRNISPIYRGRTTHLYETNGHCSAVLFDKTASKSNSAYIVGLRTDVGLSRLETDRTK